jgi:malonate transporter and related proteins
MLATLAILLPAFLVVGVSAFVGRQKLNETAIKGLSDLTFFLLLPALLFRAMATFTFDTHYLKALAGYFVPTVLYFLVVLVVMVRVRGATITAGAVLGLCATFSNTVQMGIPLTKLAFGDVGLGVLLSLVALHALVIITLATVLVEYARARTQAASVGQTLFTTIRAAVIHPVILPIALGILVSQMRWQLPPWLDSALSYLAGAAGPLCLVLLGAQLAHVRLGDHYRPAIVLVVLKNLVHPLVVGLALWIMGVRGTPLAVLTTIAALPIGSNAFLFAQRYDTRVETTTAAIALSTIACALTYTLVLTLLRFI